MADRVRAGASRSLNSLAIKARAALEADLDRAAGLNLFEHHLVLSNLSEEPSWTLRMTELSERADGSPSRLSYAVSRLVAQPSRAHDRY